MTSSVLIPEPHVSFPMEEDGRREREEEPSEPRETRAVETAPSEAVSHTSMLTRVSRKDSSEEGKLSYKDHV